MRQCRRTRGRVVFALVVAFLALPGLPAGASSLWDDRQSTFLMDRRAREVGDLVTLIIVEQAQATQNASTRTGKAAEVILGPFVGLLEGLPGLRAAGSDDLKAAGTTSRGGSLKARMTAQVVDVLPNGNLVIEGRQTIIVNGETQEIVVSGVVRPEDVARDNTVLSTFLADARIAYAGSGALGAKQKPGILTRLFTWLF